MNIKLMLLSIPGIYFVLISTSCSNKSHLEIIRVDMPLDTFGVTINATLRRTSREDYFFVDTNIKDSAIIAKNISVYIQKNLNAGQNNYDQYVIYFYKRTRYLNEKDVAKYPANVRYKAFLEVSPLFTYTWHRGKLVEVEPGDL